MKNRAALRTLLDNPDLFREVSGLLLDPLWGPFGEVEHLWKLIGQPPRSSTGWDALESALVMRTILPMYQRGDLVLLSLPLLAGPLPDKNKRGNQALLGGLRQPFSASFLGGAGGPDGDLVWTEPIQVGGFQFKPGSAPLEVGTTFATTTLDRLFKHWALARWPYGSTQLTLILPTHWDLGPLWGPRSSPHLLELPEAEA